MVDRLRALLEDPLDPVVGRAVLVFASAVVLGLAALFILAAREPEATTPQAQPKRSRAPSSLPAAPPAGTYKPEPSESHAPLRGQDPQDQEGSPAARRAARALRSHRALQHVPYRDGQLAIALVGARGDRAVLAVSAPTIRAARRGWRAFLRRYRDSGRAYLTRFEATGGHGG